METIVSYENIFWDQYQEIKKRNVNFLTLSSSSV